MELDFLAFIGNGVGVFFIPAQRKKIASVIITPEKRCQVRKDFIGQRLIVAIFGQFFTDALYFGRIVGIHATVPQRCF
ncbi:MAG: hypothetical protein KBA28_12795 [Syntrophaceae bacterium]|nr:hypothetical protein [Syntrophaceae bacterium]